MASYVALETFRAWLRIEDEAEDIHLASVITQASAAVDSYCGVTFDSPGGSATRVFAPRWPDLCYIDPAATITAVESDTGYDGTFAETWSASDYQLEPLNQRQAGLTDHPYTAIRAIESKRFRKHGKRATLRITGTWGWTTVPEAVEQATLMHAARLHERRNLPAALVAGDGVSVRTAMGIDLDVRTMLEPFRAVHKLAA